MAWSNLGFEDEDAAALGYPDIWTVSITAAAAEAAGYDDGSAAEAGPDPTEDFDGGWDSNEVFLFAYAVPQDPGELESAIYDSAFLDVDTFEDYEQGWDSNENYVFGFAGGEAASYDSGTPEAVEDYEEEWDSNEVFLFDWADVVSGPGEDAGTFDSGTPEDFEDFEEEWSFNEFYVNDWSEVAAGAGEEAASFDSGGTPEDFEDFEEVLAPFAVVADPSTDILTKTAHGLSNNLTVTFSNVGGELPQGLNSGFVYFVRDVTANTFKVTATLGGAAIDITSAGQGTHTVTPDPTVFWTEVMTTL